MSNIAILGHPTRGKEVIQLLEMLGGKSNGNIKGYNDDLYYYIAKDGLIYGSGIEYEELACNYSLFTLEEFLEKFPYKVGDKVKCWINGYCSINNIKDIQWDGIVNEIKYRIQDYWYSTINLQPYKEETMKEIKSIDLNKIEQQLDEALAKETPESLNKWLDEEPEPEPKAPILSNRYDYAEGKCGYVIPDGYEFDSIKQGFQTEIILRPIKSQYPKTYEECCKVLAYEGGATVIGYDAVLLNSFQKLKLCRDAYWKIGGKQMGLDKPWEPDWCNENKLKYCIECSFGTIDKTVSIVNGCVLAFPTKEMRDTFYENFKDLINETKELL